MRSRLESPAVDIPTSNRISWRRDRSVDTLVPCDSLTHRSCTYPPSFKAQLYLNISPSTNTSDPVNALVPSELEFHEQDSQGWELDYEIGMPVGVSFLGRGG